MIEKSDIAKARILIVNDDGIDAAGIHALEQIALSLTKDVYVVAPLVQQSGAGHSFTLHHALNVVQRDERHYAVDGTPTDCVLYACRCLLKNKKPDLLLSGINLGANMGYDVMYSGTVGAATEGGLLGIRSIAFSMCVTDFSAPLSWALPLSSGAGLLKKLYTAEWDADTLLNVNFPDIPPEKCEGISVTSLGQCKIGNKLFLNKNYAGREYFWISPERQLDDRRNMQTDVGVLTAKKRISVTPITLNWTAREQIKKLSLLF